jgi:hypothetical protein
MNGLLLGNLALPLPAGLVPVGFFLLCAAEHARIVLPLESGGILNRRVARRTALGRGWA